VTRATGSARSLRLLLAGAALTLAAACSGGGEARTLTPSPVDAPSQSDNSSSSGGHLVGNQPRIENGRIVVPAPVPAPSLPAELPPLPVQ
jgi:hypothetical protein